MTKRIDFVKNDYIRVFLKSWDLEKKSSLYVTDPRLANVNTKIVRGGPTLSVATAVEMTTPELFPPEAENVFISIPKLRVPKLDKI